MLIKPDSNLTSCLPVMVTAMHHDGKGIVRSDAGQPFVKTEIKKTSITFSDYGSFYFRQVLFYPPGEYIFRNINGDGTELYV